jgi:hypothetical protein
VLIKVLGFGVQLSTVASFLWATATTFGTQTFAIPPGTNCPQSIPPSIICPQFGGPVDFKLIVPSVGFIGVVLGFVIATIGVYFPQKPAENKGAVPATKTIDQDH